MGLTGDAKRDYQRRYMERKRSNIGSNKSEGSNAGSNTLQRTKGRTPEESGYPEGQVDVRIGPQGQKLWRLNGHYDMPNRILCFKAGRDSVG